MDLIKKNIHMSRQKTKTEMQITLDDDFNVPDVKPDINKIMKRQGEINFNDIKKLDGKAEIKGNLKFNLLYLSEEERRPIHSINGEINFDETINIDEMDEDDNIVVKWEIEDLSTSLINSRKISVKSIIKLIIIIEDIYSQETAIGIEDESVNYIKKELEVTQLVINKKDTYRVKDEIILPSNKSNVSEILYYDIVARNIGLRLMDDKFSIKGEMLVFILYIGEDDNNRIQFIETELPFSNVIDLNGSRDGMIGDIDLNILSKNIDVKPDSDGEERILDIECILDFNIKGYENEELEILSDLYSISKKLIPEYDKACYEQLLVKNNGKVRIADRVRIKENDIGILQICNVSGIVKIDEQKLVKNGIEIEGVIEVQILYVTQDDTKPLNSVSGIIPFAQTIDVKDINENCIYDVKASIEQMSVLMLDSEEIEVKASISLDTIVFKRICEPVITGLVIEDIDLNNLQEIPGIIGYIVKNGDSLWNIAKNHYTTIENLRQINEITKEEVEVGDKLLIIKKVEDVI